MKLLYLTNGVSGCGGLERVLSVKTKFFIEEYGYDVNIITINEVGCDRFFYFDKNIIFYNIELASTNKINRYISYIRKVSQIVDDTKPDIVIVCDDGIKGLYVPFWLKTPAKMVYERHAALELSSTSKVIQKTIKYASKRYDRFVVLTPSCKVGWGDNSNITVIPNPLSKLPKEQSSLSHGRAICVGSLSYNKGYDLLIDALAQVSEENWHVDIYGRGEKYSLINQAEKLNIFSNKLCFKGESKDIEYEYMTADFLILPSRTEGFGMVLIEAMSYGLPCIAFDCPNGPRHIINDGQNGFLVNQEGTSGLVEAITKMLRLSNKQKIELSKNAKKTSEDYTIGHIGKQWNEFFQRLKNL